jgi:hypothetical protein
MRYDTPIYFQTIKAGAYDASTGDYGEDIPSEERRDASVTDTGDETLTIIYGKIKQGVKTVRLQNHFDKPFDRIRIGEKAYQVDKARRLRTKHVFIVSEVP